MRNTAGQDDIEQNAELLKKQLLGQLADTRLRLGLDKKDLAQRCKLSRMTAQRAESENGSLSLTTFLKMSLGLGLTPLLANPDEANGIEPHPHNIVHRGYSHARTRSNLAYEDRQREATLATNWEAVNKADQVGWSPIVEHLVPRCTQEQASAMATVVQWLGSEVGFSFLKKALSDAGYAVTKKDKSA